MSRLTEDIQPYSGHVDGEKLLDHIKSTLVKYLALPPGAATAITLWIVCTYCIDLFRVFPKLFICSPTKRCGKTTVLEVLSGYVLRALVCSNITPAVIFRAISSEKPTMIIDEADQHLKSQNGDMASIINSGHTKSAAFILRCQPKTFETEKFSTWAPMVIAAIGLLNPTLMDRSITIALERATKAQKAQLRKLPIDFADQTLVARQMLLKWFMDNERALKANMVTPPDLGNDRAQDNWTCIFTIAAQISHTWLNECEKAYQLLEGNKQNSDPHELLLLDIQFILSSHAEANISSEELINKLREDSDSLWNEYPNGKAITPRGLSDMLKNFKIRPKTIRQGPLANKRGYTKTEFDRVFKQYL